MRAHVREVARLAGWKLAWASLLLVAAGVSEGLTILLLVPLLGYVGIDIGGDAVGRMAQAVTGALSAVGVPPSLGVVLLLYGLAASLQAIFTRYQSLFHVRLEQDIVCRLRKRLYAALFGADWLFLARERGTNLSHALTRELDRFGAATAQLTTTAATLFVGVIYLALAVAISPAVTALVVLAASLLLVALRGGASRARTAGEAFSEASAAMYGSAIEHLAGIKTIKGQAREDRAVRLFGDVADRLAAAHVAVARTQTQSRTWFDIGGIWVLALTVFVAVAVLGTSPGALLLLLFLFARIMPRIAALQQNVQQYLAMVPSVEVAIDLQARADAAAEHGSATGHRPLAFGRALRFDGVSFRYDPRASWALRDITLTVKAGTTTAIVGPSGGGKSTLADLVMGLLAPNDGIITVDDELLDGGRRRAWREQIGYVAQDTFLLHDTVRANLLWAQPAARDADIDRALTLASADRFVAALPDGLSTIIGDRGVKLSGGERQRLALARALLRQPALLVLDEATSALDSENERRIQEAIDGLHGSLTILVIAHRLSTIRHADTIHVIEAGRLVESGDWDTLLSLPGRFRQLHAAQETAGAPPALSPPGLLSA